MIILEVEVAADMGEGQVAATLIKQNQGLITMIDLQVIVVIILEEITEMIVLGVEITTKESPHLITTEIIKGNLNPESNKY